MTKLLHLPFLCTRLFSSAVLACAIGLVFSSCVTSVKDDINVPRVNQRSDAQQDSSIPQIGPHHLAIAQLVGQWDLALYSMEDSDNGKLIARGSGNIRSELGGRYLVWNTNVATGSGAQEGAGLLGYDLLQKQYEFLWVSGRTTGMLIASGEGVLMGRGISMNIQKRNPQTGQLAVGNTVLRATDLDHFVMEQYALNISGELRIRTRTVYTRVGS